MKPIELLKKKAKPLGVHQVATPELAASGEGVTEKEVQESSLQYLAELSGDEMDQFSEMWFSIRDKYLDEDALATDYRRVAVAFCWCDLDRNRYCKTLEEVWECAKSLREYPATLTTRMFIVANGANAFSGLDDETKKNSLAQSQSVKSDVGSGG